MKKKKDEQWRLQNSLSLQKFVNVRQTGGTRTSVRGPEPPLTIGAQFILTVEH